MECFSLPATEYRENAEDIIAECDRLTSLINTSLDVAEIEVGVMHGNRAPVDMKELTADACELFEAVAEKKIFDWKVT